MIIHGIDHMLGRVGEPTIDLFIFLWEKRLHYAKTSPFRCNRKPFRSSVI